MINDIQDAFDTNKGIICTHTPKEIYCRLSAEGLLPLGRFKGEGTTSLPDREDKAAKGAVVF